MFRQYVFFNQNRPGSSWRFFMVQGLALIALGLIIFFFPQILVAMISTVLVGLGSALVAFALRSKHAHDQHSQFSRDTRNRADVFDVR